MIKPNEARLSSMIENAEEISNSHTPIQVTSAKPRLHVDSCNPDRTLADLRAILASNSELFDRGGPVRLIKDPETGQLVASRLTADNVVLLTHQVSRPWSIKKRQDGLQVVDTWLPKSFANMYIEWTGEWHLLPLGGITSAPIIKRDGTIVYNAGYDQETCVYLSADVDIADRIPEHPTKEDSSNAIRVLRQQLETFCFADAPTTSVPGSDIEQVDLSKPPGDDETAAIAALLTAVARSSLDRAPAFLYGAPSISGAVAGKRLLVKCICQIAFGQAPYAVTAGENAQELEKRIAAELMASNPVLFLDNLNDTALRSNLLASALTEKYARARILGKSEMVPLRTSAFVVLTGNGLSVSEDLARRIIEIEFDPRTEDPEARRFPTDLYTNTQRDRLTLLAAALTILRWGLQQEQLASGRPLGSFEQWCQWVRDPLLELGCRDPVERMSRAKHRDPRRQQISEIFEAWHRRHGTKAVLANELHDEVRQLLDPHKRGRQYVVSRLKQLEGTRIGGFMLLRECSKGKWSKNRYILDRLTD